MIDQLYQKAILKYAASALGHGKLDNADLCITTHNPLCGDRITVYLNLDGDKISTFSHETKACVLCQASASILGECAIGETEHSLQAIHDELRHKLTEKLWDKPEWPKDKWEALNIFQPVSEHKNRMTCVTLPFESMLNALRNKEGLDNEEDRATKKVNHNSPLTTGS
ncbi:MAG: iron-sulfur cluster assembly scaffold protein [Emcibacter sp.]|nr:iron-sulfur cluster assembly scaffold protein [Emcibacter sp.]